MTTERLLENVDETIFKVYRKWLERTSNQIAAATLTLAEAVHRGNVRNVEAMGDHETLEDLMVSSMEQLKRGREPGQ